MKYRRRVVLAALVVAAIALIYWHRDRAPAPSSTQQRAGSATQASRGRAVPGPTAAGRHVAGTVLLDGAPAPGIAVRVHDAPPVLTDASGHFDLGIQRIARQVVVAEAPRVAGAAVGIDLADPTVDAEHVVLAMHACTASLHGIIRDAAGGAIPHARVTIADTDMVDGAGVEATDDGSYDLCTTPGRKVLIVTADGYARVLAEVVASGRVRRDFQLVPEVPILGRVVSAQDGAPIPGARVRLLPEDVTALFAGGEATADEEGRFRIMGVPPGRYAVQASADRFASLRAVPVIAKLGEAPEEAVCQLVPAAAVSGTVVEGGTPVAGVRVSLMPVASLEVHWEDMSAISQADGSFVIPAVRPGTYKGLAERQRATQTIEVRSSDVTGVTIAIERTASIEGRITRDGKPVDGADVHTDGAGTISDGSGRYVLRGLRPGDHQIYAESNRLGAFTPGPVVTVAKAEKKTGIDIELDLSGSVAGTVVDQDGAAVSGVVVSLSLLHGRDFGVATTAEDGSFKVTGLSGGGLYVYEVRDDERAPSRYHPVEGKHFPPVAVHDGQTHVTDLRVRIHRDRLAISGHVVTTSGQPIADAAVQANPSEEAWMPGALFGLASGTTDVSGSFAIRDLPAGSYRITVTTPYGSELLDKVAAGRTDVVIQIPAAGTIDGTLEGFSETPDVMAIRDDTGTSYRAAIHGASFSIREIPPGSYAVHAGHASQPVTLSAGGHATVVIKKRGTGSVAGAVVDAQQHPLAGLACEAAGVSSVTDPSGAYRIDGVAAGRQLVYCWSEAASAFAQATVAEGETARVDLVARGTRTGRAHAGLKLETQLQDVLVTSVEPGGPAEKAGVVAGDFVLAIDDQPVFSYDPLEQVESHPSGTVVQLKLERGDKQLSVSLTLAPAP